MTDRGRDRAVLVLAALAALAVYLTAHLLFPHHSTNHDEAVYLQQAALLLDGQLALHPPVATSFRPWFFYTDGPALYPKYTPVPAAVFAIGAWLGDARLALGAVGAAVVGLSMVLVRDVFDRRTAILTGVFVVASPLFLINTAVFLPYAPTLAFELAFAVAYFRADRSGSHRWAAAAGVAIGIAFFARPFTAVLFSAPFVVHALWTLRSLDPRPPPVTTAAFGMGGVVVALAYNGAVVGDPLVFPYEAFAPRDGLGFGRREILGYSRQYTPRLALRANAEVVTVFFTRWVVAGLVGTVLAAVGLVALIGRGWRRPSAVGDGGHTTPDTRGYQLVLAVLLLSVIGGNILFWGNLNILGRLSIPSDGLIRYLGPYYHFDLVVPVAAFAAHGVRALVGRTRRAIRDRMDPSRARVTTAAFVAATGLVVAGSAGGVLAVPVGDNADTSRQLAAAYEPFQDRPLDGALVFLPTPYGPWLNHPFQKLRNDPGYDGATVYALRERQFEVVDAFPNRTYYRYVYRGRWAPTTGDSVVGGLQRVDLHRGERVAVTMAIEVPASAESVTFELSTDQGRTYYVPAQLREDTNVTIVLANDTARLTGAGVAPTGGAASGIRVGARDTVELRAFVDFGTGGFDYRLVTPVARDDGSIRTLTPYTEVCFDLRNCGGEAASLPGETPGASIETSTRTASPARVRPGGGS